MFSLTKWKVVIVEPSGELRQIYTQVLEGDFQVTCCSRGDEAFTLIQAENPHLVIMELSLIGMDGVTLLRKLRGGPPVMVISDLLSPYVLGVLDSLGVQYAMRKPAPLQNMVDRALELACLGQGIPEVGDALEILRQLRIPGGRQGFQHLLTALPVLSRQRDQRMGKELYAHIARQSGSSVSAIEKSIRDVLHAGWAEGDREIWQKYFPGCTHCPTNKEFLFRIADQLSGWRRCG